MLNRVIVIFIIAAALVSLSVSISAAAQRQLSERGAFLEHRADSVSDLVLQLANNPTICGRYARHFGMKPQAVMSYFENNLKLVTLKKPVRSTIYFVTKNGTIKVGKRLLPAGSRVFTTQSGDLVLEWRCGNPLLGKLPKVVAPKVTVVPVTPVVTPPVVAANPVEGPIEIVTTPPVSTAVLPSLEQTSTVLSPTITGVEPAVEVAAAAPVAAVPGPSFLSSAKALPLLLPLLVGGSKVFNSHSPDVPEPTSILAFTTGLATAAITWRRRRRN